VEKEEFEFVKSQNVVSQIGEDMAVKNGKTDNAPIVVNRSDIGQLIHTIRGQQVMLDYELAPLYGYEVKRLNQQAKRNLSRFPDDFMFQLTKEEITSVKLQNVTSPDSHFYTGQEGGSRKPPYAFTEQGIYMLATVLKGKVAEQQSISIMRAFREMRHFIASNALLFERVSTIELRQLEYQKSADEKFDKVFRYMEDHAEAKQKIFFAGQIYDAFNLITSLIQKAQKDIILIDGYVDVNTLNILSKKNIGVDAKIYTYPSTKLTDKDIATFNAQYPNLIIKKTSVFHDRFIVVDQTVVYRVGASLKDAGSKCFAVSLMEDPGIATNLLDRLKSL
jgi:hypothetical protein